MRADAVARYLGDRVLSRLVPPQFHIGFIDDLLCQIHMAIHTGEKGDIRQLYMTTLIVAYFLPGLLAYICPEAGCHRCFSVRSNMNRHIRNVHQIWPDSHEEASDSETESP